MSSRATTENASASSSSRGPWKARKPPQMRSSRVAVATSRGVGGDRVEDGGTADLQVGQRARAQARPEVDGLRPVLVLERRDARGVGGSAVDDARRVLEAKRADRRRAREPRAHLVDRQHAAVFVLPAVDLRSEGGRLQPGAVVIGLVPEAEHRVHTPHGHRERIRGRVLELEALDLGDLGAVVLRALEHGLGEDTHVRRELGGQEDVDLPEHERARVELTARAPVDVAEDADDGPRRPRLR